MAKTGYRPGAGRPKGSKTVREPALTELNGKRTAGHATRSPLQYLLAVMNNPDADEARRDRAAIAALPYCHLRAVEKAPGKKAQANAAAETAHQGSDWNRCSGRTDSKSKGLATLPGFIKGSRRKGPAGFSSFQPAVGKGGAGAPFPAPPPPPLDPSRPGDADLL